MDTHQTDEDHLPVLITQAYCSAARLKQSRPQLDPQNLKNPACQPQFRQALFTIPPQPWQTEMNDHAYSLSQTMNDLATSILKQNNVC